MGKPLRQIVADNINRRMQAHPELSKQLKLAKRAKVGEATIDRLRKQTTNALDPIEKIAGALGCQPWELLLDPDEAKEEVIRRFFGKP